MKSQIPGRAKEFFKYCISGAIGAGIDFSLFSLLVTYFHIDYLFSNLISFSTGTIIVCYMQKNWTFQYVSKGNFQLYSRYLFGIGIVFLINNILLIYAIEIIHFGDIQAKFIQIVLSAILGYLIQKKFVFAKTE